MDYGVKNTGFSSSGSQGSQGLRSEISGPGKPTLSLPFPWPHLPGSRAPEITPSGGAKPPILTALLQITPLHSTQEHPLPGLLELPRFLNTALAPSAGGSGQVHGDPSRQGDTGNAGEAGGRGSEELPARTLAPVLPQRGAPCPEACSPYLQG